MAHHLVPPLLFWVCVGTEATVSIESPRFTLEGRLSVTCNILFKSVVSQQNFGVFPDHSGARQISTCNDRACRGQEFSSSFPSDLVKEQELQAGKNFKKL